MKKLLYTTILAVLLFGACKPKDKEKDPEPTATISLSAIHSAYYFSEWTPQYYKGDTIRYTVNVSSQKDVTSYTASVNGATINSASSFGNAQSFTQDFFYVITQNPGQTVSITFKVVENTGKETIKTESFNVRSLKELTNLKLFNKRTVAGADSLYWVLKHKTRAFSSNPYYVDEQFINTQGTEMYYSFATQLITTTSVFGNTSKVFEKKIFTNNNQNRFCKVNASYADLDEPNEIITAFHSIPANISVSQGGKMYISDYNIGDVYILEYANSSGVPYNYFVFKITDIYDDGLTSDDIGGHDNDYTKFDIKFFSLSRF